ncbi:MAG: metallophosphoesterase [Bacilli bacterium]|nr:metallophosphoesterase [Bacilli bacterium]
MSKIILTEYNVTNHLLKKHTKIATFGDIHGEYGILESFKDIMKDLKVTAVLITGDMIESVVGSDYSREKIVELLQEISKYATIVCALGNHDGVYKPGVSEEDRDRICTENYYLWSKLRNTDNVYVPKLPEGEATATQVHLTDDIDVCIVNMPMDYYWFRENPKEYVDYIRTLEMLQLSSEKFNMLLAHSPKNIVNGNSIDEYIKNLKKINMILSGHMHAGLIPYNLRNNSGIGLTGPGKKMFPKNSYGVVEDEGVISLTTGGATKIADGSFGAPIKEIPGVKKLLDVIYPPELEIINLNPGMDNTINKVKELRYKD